MKKIALINLKYLALALSALLLVHCEDDPTEFGMDPIPDPGPDIVINESLSFDSPLFKSLYPDAGKDSTIATYPATTELIIPFAGYTDPPGCFVMGNDATSGYLPEEKPQHYVALDGFKAMRYEVTVDQFRQFVAANPGKVKMPKEPFWGHFRKDPTTGLILEDRTNHPIVNVTWKEAKAYAEWVGGRLPTEAEFEFMAGGLWRDRKNYAVSTDINNSAWFFTNSYQLVTTIIQNGVEIERWGRMPHQVGALKTTFIPAGDGVAQRSAFTIWTTIQRPRVAEEGPNSGATYGGYNNADPMQDPILVYPERQGVADISGNVMEWCSDWLGLDYYERCSKRQTNDVFWDEVQLVMPGQNPPPVPVPDNIGLVFNPKGPETGEMKIVRGGSFLLYNLPARKHFRLKAYPGTRDEQIGFRVVWDLDHAP